MLIRGREPAKMLEECLRMVVEEDQTIDAVLARYPEHDEELRPALEAAAWLSGRRGAVESRPGFASASRGRLITRIRSGEGASQIAPLWLVSLVWWYERRKRVVFAVLALVLALQLAFNVNGLARAEHTWLPGDAFYPLRTTSESLRLLVSLDASQDARLHIEFAQRRILEVQALIIEGRYERVPAAVEDFEGHVDAAVRAVNELAGDDAYQARQLALELREVLGSQTNLVALLAGWTPAPIRLACERVIDISQGGASAVEEMLSPSGLEPWQSPLG
jgi:hypothetical protein